MDVDGERFLTILYVSNFAELPRSVLAAGFITVITTALGPHYHVNVGTGYTYKLDINDGGSMRLDEPDEVFR